MERDPIRMCQLLIGLGDVTVLGVIDGWPGRPLEVHIEVPAGDVVCDGCGAGGVSKDRDRVRLVDLPCFGRQTRLVWHKRRWACTNGCGSWTEQAATIAAPRHALTDRAGRWATFQVGRWGRSVREVAAELGCDWHTVNNAVIAFGTPLVDAPDRIGTVTALGLDEAAFARIGRRRRRLWSTSIVDVQACRLLDVVEGRDALPAVRWLQQRDPGWRAAVEWATLDLAGTYRSVFDTMLPDAVQVADPFHVVKVRHEAPCVRGRVRDPTRRPVAAGR